MRWLAVGALSVPGMQCSGFESTEPESSCLQGSLMFRNKSRKRQLLREWDTLSVRHYRPCTCLATHGRPFTSRGRSPIMSRTSGLTTGRVETRRLVAAAPCDETLSLRICVKPNHHDVMERI